MLSNHASEWSVGVILFEPSLRMVERDWRQTWRVDRGTSASYFPHESSSSGGSSGPTESDPSTSRRRSSGLVQVDDPRHSRDQEELANQHFRQSKTLARILCRDEVSITRRRERGEGEKEVLGEGSVTLGAEKGRSFVGGGGTIHEREKHPDQEIGGNRSQDGLQIDDRSPHEVTYHRDGRDQIEQAADRGHESGGGVVMEEQAQNGRHNGEEETDGGNDSDRMRRCEIRRMIETVATCTTMTTDGPQDVVRLMVST